MNLNIVPVMSQKRTKEPAIIRLKKQKCKIYYYLMITIAPITKRLFDCLDCSVACPDTCFCDLFLFNKRYLQYQS